MIYLNNCLTSKPDDEVLAAMMPYLTDKFYLPFIFVSSGEQISTDIESFKETIAKPIGAQSKEIHFTSGGTSANNLAIKGFLTANSNRGNHIICSVIDYPDILSNAAFFEDAGFEVSYIEPDENGFISASNVEKAIREDTILFMGTLVNHTVGTTLPMVQLKPLFKKRGIKVFVDGCEAFGRVAVDVEKMGIDMMSISAHKIHGTKGVGALYKRSGILLNQIKHGVARVDNLETGAVSIAAISGFAKATELAFQNNNMSHIRNLRNYLYGQIVKKIPNTLLNSSLGEDGSPHHLNISFDYIEGEAIMMMLSLKGILLATGSACSSADLSMNYVLKAMGRTHVQSHGSVKFTLSRKNTKAEIDHVVKNLKDVVEELRRRSPLGK